MSKRSFTKMHGLGNDFVVFDATREPLSLTARQARQIADRHLGIGCDQILIVDPPPSDEVDFGYRIINGDGSESGQCGNGARCIARFIHDHHLADKQSLRVRTLSGDMQLQLLDDNQVQVDMGVPRFEPSEIPFSATGRRKNYHLIVDDDEAVEFGAVSMGNPHAVMHVTNIDQTPVARLGGALQAHETFPESVNVGFMQVVNETRVRLRVFERGVGETRACGSGACAAVAVGRDQGVLAETVSVMLPGGILQVTWPGEGLPLLMTGPAVSVFDGSIEIRNLK